jgi:hypothetical protein
MGKAPSEKHRLTRIDNNKGFSPENCEWRYGNTYLIDRDIGYICINDEKQKQTILAAFDTVIFTEVDKHKWFIHRKNGQPYYVVTKKQKDTGKSLYLHHLILPRKEGLLTDHKNGDGTDNRACNLRYATHETNGINRHKINAKSGYQGVYFHKATNKWAAQLGQKNRINIGLFSTKEDAATAYRTEAIKQYGEFVPQ